MRRITCILPNLRHWYGVYRSPPRHAGRKVESGALVAGWARSIARDSKLGHDVAIKILPARFTSDPERRARFAREARLLATLNHPHIGAIGPLSALDLLRRVVPLHPMPRPQGCVGEVRRPRRLMRDPDMSVRRLAAADAVEPVLHVRQRAVAT